MPFIVETGAGDPNAESYISIAEADAYFESIGNTSWGVLPFGQKEAALRRATNYMLETYQLRWKGRRTNVHQALDWPRWDVQAGNLLGTGAEMLSPSAIPVAVRRVTALFALQSVAGSLSPVLKPPIVSKTIGPIKVVYDVTAQLVDKYTAQEKMLAPYLKGGVSGSMVKLVRS